MRRQIVAAAASPASRSSCATRAFLSAPSEGRGGVSAAGGSSFDALRATIHLPGPFCAFRNYSLWVKGVGLAPAVELRRGGLSAPMLTLARVAALDAAYESAG